MSISKIQSVLVASALVIFIGSGSAHGEAPDCRLAEGYITRAHQQLVAGESAEAESLLKQSIEACPTYEAFQSLGELQSQSPRRADQVQAVDAFVSADELAPSAEARARTRYRYASLLSRDGDPKNAYQLIRDAQQLDPANTDIAQLSSQIERQVHNPTQEHIVRGAGTSIYKPLRTPAVATDAHP